MENENIIEHTYADEVSPLTLAFVGDGVYDLLAVSYTHLTLPTSQQV